MSSITIPFSGTGPLLLFLAKATLLLVAALVATVSLRRSTAGARHLVWLAALVGVLALPALSRIPALQLGILPSSFGRVDPISAPKFVPAIAAAPAARAIAVVAPAIAAPAAPAAVAPVMPARVPAPRALPMPGVAPAIAVGPTPIAKLVWAPRVSRDGAPAMGVAVDAAPDFGESSAYSVLTIIAIVWTGVALALLGWLVAGAIHVRRIVRGARELTTPDWTTPLCEVADRLDLELPPRLVLSDRIEMAFACRALSPTIVLPAAAESWTDDRRRAVLFHELAHIKRHDLLGHTLGRIACALYWFHPLVWTAAKNLRAESERACDDLVLSCGARPSEYAQHLLDMVTSVRNHGAPVMALPMARKKEFEGRMLAILDPAIRRASPGKLEAAGVLVSLATLSLTIAAASPATAASAPAMASVTAAPAMDTAVRMGARSPRVTATTPQVQSDTREPVRGDAIGRITTAAVNAVSAAVGPYLKQAGQLAQVPQVVQQGDTAKIAMLIKILETDSDASVRKTAAWALNDAGGERVRSALTKTLKSDADGSVREMAAWALADHDTEAVAAALADALLHDKSTQVRATSAWALGQLGSQKEIGALESGMSDADASVREVSIWAIGQLGPRTAPRGLVNALTDNSRQVRLVAAWALGEIEDKAPADAIVKAFQSETDTEIRGAELRALSAMGAVSPALVETVLNSKDPELRRRAVGMLAGNNGVWPWPWPWPQPRPFP